MSTARFIYDQKMQQSMAMSDAYIRQSKSAGGINKGVKEAHPRFKRKMKSVWGRGSVMDRLERKGML